MMESYVWQLMTIEDIFLTEDAEETQNQKDSAKK